jgi:hypothetical protein
MPTVVVGVWRSIDSGSKVVSAALTAGASRTARVEETRMFRLIAPMLPEWGAD